MEITKLKWVLELKQKPWMKNYLNKITQLRTRSTSVFYKYIPKNVNYSLYRKEKKIVRKRNRVQNLTSSEKLKRTTYFNIRGLQK